MANRIEYLVGYEHNYYYNGLQGYPGSWSAYDTAPEDIDLLLHVNYRHLARTNGLHSR